MGGPWVKATVSLCPSSGSPSFITVLPPCRDVTGLEAHVRWQATMALAGGRGFRGGPGSHGSACSGAHAVRSFWLKRANSCPQGLLSSRFGALIFPLVLLLCVLSISTDLLFCFLVQPRSPSPMNPFPGPEAQRPMGDGFGFASTAVCGWEAVGLASASNEFWNLPRIGGWAIQTQRETQGFILIRFQ